VKKSSRILAPAVASTWDPLRSAPAAWPGSSRCSRPEQRRQVASGCHRRGNVIGTMEGVRGSDLRAVLEFHGGCRAHQACVNAQPE
jgi:hypothetical protein